MKQYTEERKSLTVDFFTVMQAIISVAKYVYSVVQSKDAPLRLKLFRRQRMKFFNRVAKSFDHNFAYSLIMDVYLIVETDMDNIVGVRDMCHAYNMLETADRLQTILDMDDMGYRRNLEREVRGSALVSNFTKRFADNPSVKVKFYRHEPKAEITYTDFTDLFY